MTNRRIIDQTEALSLSGDDYLVADNANLGTRKIQFTRLLSGATPLPPNYKTGLEISRVSATEFSVANGYARSDDNSRNMQLSSSIIKDISSTFDLGNNAGCMPSGLTLQANTTYYVFLISTSGGTSDVIIDTDENCQNGLADNVVVLNNFDKFTKIGYFITNVNSQIDLALIENNDFKIKTGMILPWASPNIPDGYLLCAGYELSRTTFSKLFSVIGTTWGAGNGTTTFNIPDFTNVKFLNTTATTIGVKGNGNGLGLYVRPSGWQTGANDYYLTFFDGNQYYAKIGWNSTVPAVGTQINYINQSSDRSAVGVSTITSQSGIVAEMPSTLTIKWIIKY